jgi:solute carrier family 15 (oligopeptide transporter), member 1
MNGQVGSLNIKPEQMTVVNPVLILLLIPIFDRIIYPAFARYTTINVQSQ